MINVETYFDNFKPTFNEERFKELVRNPPTNFMTDKGNVNIRKELSASILVACKMLWKEFDRNNVYYGGEGGGKSHTAFQHSYVWWWYLNELGMINYEFGLHIVYGRVKDLMENFDKYANIPFMIYTLDESEELNRKNWNNKVVKEFMGKLRRERKNLRIVNLILPALEELLPSIALSRINWIFQIDVELDHQLNPIRGHYSMLNVPVGTQYFSEFKQDYVTQKEIKSYLNARFYDTDKKFESLPRSLLSITGKTNATFVFDTKEYKKWARDINKKRDDEENNENNEKLIKMTEKIISAMKTLKSRKYTWNDVAELMGFTSEDSARKWFTRNGGKTD